MSKIDFEASIAPWLGRTVKMVEYHLHEALLRANLDMTKEQMVILMTLNEQDGLNQNQLALLTFRDKSSLARLLATMEKKGYLYKKQDAIDKRVNQVYLTAFGKEAFDKATPILKNIIDVTEKKITISEKEQLISILKKIQTNLS